MGALVHLPSLDRVSERLIEHLSRGHHTAIIGSPGCGTTTFVAELVSHLESNGFIVKRLDARVQSLAELSREVSLPESSASSRRVLFFDHITRLLPDEYSRFLMLATKAVATDGCTGLWCGNVDVRAADRQLGLKLCSAPSAHISFPILTRDELLATYAAISEDRKCRWGDAVLHLMLDLCGTDLTLVQNATEYFYGNWSNPLHDQNVWDRVQEWLKADEAVDAYRTRLRALPPSSKVALALIRFGGKPRCLRPELLEEVDDGLRRLWLDGFIMPNLLPGFYQVRNLVVRFLLDESHRPESLFCRASNERAGVLLQDAETMLRHVLASVFTAIGLDEVRSRLETMQQPGEVIDSKLNRSLLDWARATGSPDITKTLNELLQEHRSAFKKANSVWETVTGMMLRDDVPEDGSPHIHCIDYLTFEQLSQLVLDFTDQVFPFLADDREKPRLRERWREAVAKVRRLRNEVAHLRNVAFQDMEDLARTLDRMRQDIIAYGSWKTATVANADHPTTTTRSNG